MPQIPSSSSRVLAPDPATRNAVRLLLEKEFGVQVHSALRSLFQKKQLYQSERVSVPEFAEKFPQLINPQSTAPDPRVRIAVNVGTKTNPQTQYKALSIDQMKGLSWLWPSVQTTQISFSVQTAPSQPICEPSDSNDNLLIQLPIVKRHCENCEITTPHHPGFLGANPQHPGCSINPTPTKRDIQIFLLPYQCQQCRNEPLVFMVRREGVKFQLTGRSLFAMEPTPDYVPKYVRTFYSESLVATSAGKPLAGCLYLRLVVEHHMRSFVQLPPKATGDELADAYAQVLHPEFPRSRASLRAVYSELSEVIHAGREDAEVFGRCLSTLHEHFRTLDVIPIPQQKEDGQTAKASTPPAQGKRPKPPRKKV